jgi:hypothetical protein
LALLQSFCGEELIRDGDLNVDQELIDPDHINRFSIVDDVIHK